MQRSTFIPLILLLVLLVSKCAKEEDFTDKQLLSSTEGKSWLLNEVYADTANITDDYPSCILDNERIFYSDARFELTEGDSTCQDIPEETLSGTWTFNDIKTTLKIAIGTDTMEYIIRELGKNTMRLYYIDQDDGIEYNWKLVTK